MVIALDFKTEAADLIKNAFKYFYVFRFDLCLLIKKNICYWFDFYT